MFDLIQNPGMQISHVSSPGMAAGCSRMADFVERYVIIWLVLSSDMVIRFST